MRPKQCNSTNFWLFFDASQIMGYTRKIDEFDPVFSLQKTEKGWFYQGSLALVALVVVT